MALIAIEVCSSDVFGQVDLRERLGREEFEQAGLSRLTDEELTHLNRLIGDLLGEETSVVRTQVAPTGEESFGLESVPEKVAALFQSSPETVESRILGEFRGWRGNTFFKLANGQIWRQIDSDHFVVRLEDPRVTIRRAALGSYLLSVEGYNSSVRVRRVE